LGRPEGIDLFATSSMEKRGGCKNPDHKTYRNGKRRKISELGRKKNHISAPIRQRKGWTRNFWKAMKTKITKRGGKVKGNRSSNTPAADAGGVEDVICPDRGSVIGEKAKKRGLDLVETCPCGKENTTRNTKKGGPQEGHGRASSGPWGN